MQLASNARASLADDLLNLDVYAINELQDKKVPCTNDSLKYSYKAKDNKDAAYGLFLSSPFISENIFYFFIRILAVYC
jgi:hypothetical protein